ncbi:MAG TPA: SEC-C metal-binding domain-containing protein, partial [Actinomycetes bacterium]|nr:SEC-C metal-binding domain-containing protein [Actinomycetes bacterium]
GGRSGVTQDMLLTELRSDIQVAYDAREESLGEDVARELERRVVLSVLDRKWREHLYEMDYLQEGIGLRAHAQRDPLVEYQREGYNMFSQMLDGIKEEVVGLVFHIQVQVAEPEQDEAPVIDPGAARLLPQAKPVEIRSKGLGQSSLPRALSYSSPTLDGDGGGGVNIEQAPALGLGGPQRPTGPQSARSAGAKMPAPGQVVGSSGPSRNAPCYCGSGKKYKRCHGAPAGGA